MSPLRHALQSLCALSLFALGAGALPAHAQTPEPQTPEPVRDIDAVNRALAEAARCTHGWGPEPDATCSALIAASADVEATTSNVSALGQGGKSNSSTSNRCHPVSRAAE